MLRKNFKTNNNVTMYGNERDQRRGDPVYQTPGPSPTPTPSNGDAGTGGYSQLPPHWGYQKQQP